MANDFMENTGVLMENEDNAMWQIYEGDFPITAYDRPSLAFSNLLLRGNVDAATRAIFSPQSLSPKEMQTITKQLMGGKKNPLIKTVLDVATNPLVIIGILMAIKYH